MMKSQEIRSKFLEFFESKKHKIVSSAPMVIKNDPTLMFTNAGMNQFKEFFLGNGKPQHTRIADTQKCLRVSGKHNDLEEVGRDTYHHTMFEMLGNWSFGDYFKEEAIDWAWELLTQVYGIDKEILYVTIFEGDEKEGIERDNQAFEFWKKHLPENRILNGSKKDNFWEMGDQGPCGPCTEIHVDLRDEAEKQKISGRDLVNNDHPLVVEIWNLVFMQFNRKADGSLERLSAQHVDTGMGFERLCMVLQNKKSNYDTDVFTPIIQKIEQITQHSYGKDEKTDIAIRVIADHIRAVSFSIADGQLPSNTGAGYVIRRILRRAIRYGFTFLNQKEAFIFKLVEVLSVQMGDFFPEIKKQQHLIETIIKEEENSFLGILEQGLILIDSLMNNSTQKHISGVKAFELYDTYGFPIDLTALILSERGFTLDYQEFEVELQKQKERSRVASKVKAGDWEFLQDVEKEEFIGYDVLQSEVKITRYRKVQSQKDGTLYQLVFDKTPFYAESGGQVGDQGILKSSGGEEIQIIDTKKENNLIIHLAKQLPKNVSGSFTAIVDAQQRLQICCNHTATHLLHQALRAVLGEHIEQKGSRVDSQSLRFDFSHFSKMSSEEIQQVEDFVNQRIREKICLKEHREIPISQALQMGAIALFGEKYGESVRMIEFGDSRELCGGTHIGNTADIWHFKIVSEGAVASGVRRIEAITNAQALAYFKEQENLVQQVREAVKNPQEPIKSIVALQLENAKLIKEIEQLKKLQSRQVLSDLKAKIQQKQQVNFLAERVDLELAILKDMAFELGGECQNLFLIFGSQTEEGKAMLLCYISKDLVQSHGLDAGKIVRELGKFIQGGGGGQPFFATAGGKNPQGIEKALAQAVNYIQKS